MSVVVAVLGIAVVVLTWVSVLGVLVVPRRTREPLTRAVNALTDAGFRLLTTRVHSYRRRDRILAGQAAVVILVQLGAWLCLFYLGFALILHSIDRNGIRDAFAQAGSSLFTLGYAGPDTGPLSVVDYVAAATGLVVVALQIGYLPTLYSAFNRRETEVTLLASRAGTPAWGPEILARTRFGVGEDDEGAVMDEFYLGWERWAADVSESHANYPVLMRFRSPAKYSSWVVALVAVMDSAALWLALSPGRAPAVEARLALRMGFTALHEIAETLGIPFDRDPDPDGELALSYGEFLTGIERIRSTTFVMERSAEEAWPDFRGWRVNYEPVAYALAERLDVVPAPWTGTRRTGDATVEPIRPPNRRPTPAAPRSTGSD
ncbi:hypothetical protein N865_01765 [Intrasporangium oryzae NRRL B-24470]|uniref:Potassium channel domain-containing protein n=1 Tax=Intrasporangium oryzae NRRL B-24470 TaxID=1386089 RepID=W9GAT4_9MICO|nr:hypothetical protein [Intrasporangium oryzae]EWT03165.1 hypothetical protein N865_01765 [Intrasporangium oryzae NRRL B-24470]